MTGHGPGDVRPALAVAYELHPPTPGRAPEVAAPGARASRRKAVGRRRDARNVRG
ncbi:hypothetical protein RKD23_004062 [Streptomyces sp. SAI-170]|uniref:hypothetical protein n=1 Tax=Streptomyces sp. SAI-170 TaxID=3377729 RepID=UPI003C7D28F4